MTTSSQKRFGTFSGVFIPNVLTIFGVILFYREGWLVGNAGLIGAILIIALANLITVATALSLSAIVTNIKVKGGGAYYLVSRSLGPEMGGAIGICLFFAQAFSISFYIIGFTKIFLPFFPGLSPELLNTITLIILTFLSIFSAEVAIKSQLLIFVIVMLALFSFFAGNLPGTNEEVIKFIGSDIIPANNNFIRTLFSEGLKFSKSPVLIGSFKDASFWKTFAIFFPAVTGIFAGLSLSGDLKEPNKNIPKGTILAIFFTFVFYILVAVLFAFNFSSDTLISNEKLMMTSSRIPAFVFAGICAATLSSAVGVLLGAPRTLQALAKDEIVARALAKGSGPNNEPRRAMLFSVLLAEGLLLFGGSDMNFVSQLLTMFFLSSYGIVNFIAAIEVIIGNPGYRPKFKVHWSISLLGAFSSFAAMFLINKWVTLVALVIIIGIYFYYTRKGLEKEWGDIRKGFWASLIEISLSNYEKYEEHPRNWRPHIAIFEIDRRSREKLINLASLVVGKRGIISDYIFIDKYMKDAGESVETETKNLKDMINEKNIHNLYPEIILTNKDKNSHLITLQSDGIGSFKANTIITDFYDNDKSLYNHLLNIRSYDQLKKNMILYKQSKPDFVYDDRIDIWLSGFKANISMMVLIPFLLTKNIEWSKTRIYIRMIVRNNNLKEKAEQNINTILQTARINGEVKVISLEEKVEEGKVVLTKKQFDTFNNKEVKKINIVQKLTKFIESLEFGNYSDKERQSIKTIIHDTSKDARLVVLGLRIPEKGKESNYASDLTKMLKDLPQTILVKGHYNINLFK